MSEDGLIKNAGSEDESRAAADGLPVAALRIIILHKPRQDGLLGSTSSIIHQEINDQIAKPIWQPLAPLVLVYIRTCVLPQP